VLRYLLILVLFFIVARTFWRVVDGLVEGATGRREIPRQKRGQSPTKLVRDPVCGTYVVPNATLSLTSGGGTHYFCSEGCRNKYRESP
jgi:YHS domain-containing protein